MVATSFDSDKVVREKYSNADAVLRSLKQSGVIVIHEVDATALADTFDSNSIEFDRIIFNFPHSGSFISSFLPHLNLRSATSSSQSRAFSRLFRLGTAFSFQ